MNKIGKDFCPQSHRLGELLELRMATDETMSLEDVALALECSEQALWKILMGHIKFWSIPRNVLENCASYLAIPLIFLYAKVGAVPLCDFSVKGHNRFRHPAIHGSDTKSFDKFLKLITIGNQYKN